MNQPLAVKEIAYYIKNLFSIFYLPLNLIFAIIISFPAPFGCGISSLVSETLLSHIIHIQNGQVERRKYDILRSYNIILGLQYPTSLSSVNE